jgi:antitoxin component of MazEF toxin-antitoxin module
MIYERIVSKVGTSLGVVIPSDVVKYLGWEHNQQIIICLQKNIDGEECLVIKKLVTPVKVVIGEGVDERVS